MKIYAILIGTNEMYGGDELFGIFENKENGIIKTCERLYLCNSFLQEGAIKINDSIDIINKKLTEYNLKHAPYYIIVKECELDGMLISTEILGDGIIRKY